MGCNAIDATALAILSRHHDLLRRAASSRRRKEAEDNHDEEQEGEEEGSFADLADAAHACWDEIDEAAWESAGDDGNGGGKCGRVVHLVSFVEGTLRRVSPALLAQLEGLPSVAAVELSVGPGSALEPTRDISATDCGQVRMVNSDPAALERDYAAVVAAMPLLFEVA